MFDFGMSEMMVIAAVGLVVLGPERLPQVARTAGQWAGKARQYITDLKSDIDREIELSELKKIQEEAKKTADELNTDLQKTADSLNASVKEAGEAAESAAKEVESAAKEAETAINEAKADQEAQAGEDTAGDGDDFSGDNSDDWEGYDSDYAEVPQPSLVFDKRYHPGPSFDQITEQVDSMRRILAMNDSRSYGNTHKYAPRARSNRVRIYR